MTRFEQKSVLVTGSTSGIGRSIAEAFAKEGAFVVITGRNEQRGEQTAASIVNQGGRATFVRSDLAAGGDAISVLADAALTASGGTIDILVNNAAALIPAQSLFDATEAQIDDALTVNVKVPFLLTAAITAPMIARGSGVVVNIGSVNGIVGMSVAALYGASKAALHSLTKSWAAELAPLGIRVNTVAPGPTMTDTNEPYWSVLQELSTDVPDGRPGTAHEVASAVLFLASDEAKHIHGATLTVDGGMTTR
ncbi:SDR family NAD(P)-dependent oxidoreductase [Subtercola endophyticus]|uniref:SDR family NAD(P)-dependent oxidoreductase n=1 Tax=Subtercola endophyticus TaxID=2895559 RepID=UPI001E5C898F|nr:glucose 1-dehydrogenase [Subtercola endophyticus]UFS58188.1 glucose 1-dehydrogenase [Subtercola endophyticus]